ncbi:FG-GAP-like repeat-containing protein [Streptomyces sp. Y1]|uniref:FG-GAP-like repeat-containing protein n=3 Tax=Streptomyces TaxID=1883 RepID=A0AB39TVI1_9ACTN
MIMPIRRFKQAGLAAIVAATAVSGLMVAPAHASTTSSIAATATAEVGNGPCAHGGYWSGLSSQSTSCGGSGGQSQAWCADFVGWVWSQNGVAHLSAIDNTAASVYDYGKTYGTLHSTPQVGDAVVYNYDASSDYADHVALVTAVGGGSITVVGGNEGHSSGHSQGIVQEESTSQYAEGDAPWGQVISGYISPVVKPSVALNFSQTVGGNYNGDKVSDLFAKDSSGNLFVWTGNKGGAFSTRKQLTGGWNFTQTATADFTGDGFGDLVASDTSGNLYLWTGNAGGAFSTKKLLTSGWNYTQTVAGDFRGTGHADLIAQDASRNLYLWPGNGDGTFGAKKLLTSGWNFTQTTAADFNGDGIADLVARDSSGNLYLWTGNAGGAFSTKKLLTGGWDFTQTTAGDFTGSGHADLIARDDTTGTLYRWAGNGAGGFAAKVQVTTGW